MTLEDATSALLAAIEVEDLEAAAHALSVRESALRAGAIPTRDALEQGERAGRALTALKQKWALESARLSQVNHFTSQAK